MDTRSEIREFLTSRRAKIKPDQVGLTAYGPRRVPGLRREEVAVLAGVSVPYYTRLERGDMSGVSEGVLDALARALQLDDAERARLPIRPRADRPHRRALHPQRGIPHRLGDHNVRLHKTGAKRFNHPVVGELTRTFEMMQLAADPGLHLLTFTAEPGSKSEEALNLLGSWAATLEREQTASTRGEA